MFHVRCKTGLWRCLWDRGWSIPPQWWTLFPFRRTLHVSFQLFLTLCNPMDWSPPGSSVHGILQARILAWVAYAFLQGPSHPRYWTWISCDSWLQVDSLLSGPPGKPSWEPPSLQICAAFWNWNRQENHPVRICNNFTSNKWNQKLKRVKKKYYQQENILNRYTKEIEYI